MSKLSRGLSFGRSASLHRGVGLEDDDGGEVRTVAPATSVGEGKREGSSVGGEIVVTELTMDLIDGYVKCHNDGFGSKVCCLCCPVATNQGDTLRYYTENPDRLQFCGVAVRKSDPLTPLGQVQIAPFPLQDKNSLHKVKPGETYVEEISVSAGARGLGIGTKLLQWAEDTARKAGSNHMTLGVLNGNPAQRLYERVGYRVIECDDAIEKCCACFFVTLFVGRPYGLCDPHWGAVDMRKDLP
ncbi:N-acetyltransferase domain-containing protein [Chloropicon primus]|uniref:N-acetyltransferase domain-containing protein n=1 Tax=Chloropicon primus TaxID=1764295 RepID=A0A5B8MIJ3_9CHLO|nr:hypothetical protein A3770_04p29760 [Chloropicon primus]UPQ99667.1 N-acetyltransferase domain-containing protein [Chloropicon primus]|eukprot:QDZ20458.1 hypothetical protein A3770_04p29760 [Chloropicon primus]